MTETSPTTGPESSYEHIEYHHLSDDYQIFEVTRYYQHGKYQYEETCFYRGSLDKLEKALRGELEDFAGKASKGKIVWNYEEQDALSGESGVTRGARTLEISAREIDSIDDLYIGRL